MKTSLFAIAVLVFMLLSTGCSRQRYRVRADQDAYNLIAEKVAGRPWDQPEFNIETDIDSRLSHLSCADDPQLPTPDAELYSFEVPKTVERPASRFFDDPLGFYSEFTGSLARRIKPPAKTTNEIIAGRKQARFRHVAFDDEGLEPRDTITQLGQLDVQRPIQTAVAIPVVQTKPDDPPGDPRPDVAGENEGDLASRPRNEDLDGERPVVPIDEEAWNSVPKNCLVRALEFQSVRDEYARTFEADVPDGLFDSAEQLALEDLLQLAVKHSREFQTAKETLYRASLRLSLQRYAFQLKFTPTGNGANVDWTQNRVGGITEDTLGIGTGAAVDKVLATGGNLLARFANDVILTFNGPQGFATDVGSELLTEITQPLLQRDIVFEQLTQAERDVVYAARDYARFRKQFFRDIASDYYNLLLTYRSIEIDMLDYFANQRGFEQAKAEFETANRIPPFQVDQFEQNALDSRSRVIRSCNNLEQGFDSLKLRLGIPTETPINLDLTELDLITARDEVMVASELSRRRSGYLERAQRRAESASVEKEQLVFWAIQLAQRLEGLLEVRSRLESKREGADETEDGGPMSIDQGELSRVSSMISRLQVESLAIAAARSRGELAREVAGRKDANKLINLRSNYIQNLIDLGIQQKSTYGIGPSTGRFDLFEERLTDAFAELNDVDARLREAGTNTASDPTELRKKALGQLPLIADDLGDLVNEIESQVTVEERLDAQQLVSDALELGSSMLTPDSGGLAPIDIGVDEAMLTSMVTRFDLMNERGALADAWRQIKLTGDDLRSVLNLRASHTIRTDPTNDNPVDFQFDESQTNVGLTFDLPLNRRAQRNNYRVALINYNVALRNLMQLEDEIKFSIRNDLRNLQLDQEQYAIAVASAALASDRRFGTRLQFQLQQGNVRARDVLEAQQAYTASLNSVARAHIDYILDRIDLFLDLELLQVDEANLWPELYNESHQPEVRLSPPEGSGPAYGRLPGRVRYSSCIRRMDCIPFGPAKIYGEDFTGGQEAADSQNELSPDMATEPSPIAAPVPTERPGLTP